MGSIVVTEFEKSILDILDTQGGFLTTDVAKRVPAEGRTVRQQSSHTRSVLLGLEEKGLIGRLDDQKPVCWVKKIV